MNTYTYEDIQIGQTESFTLKVGAEQMKLFRDMTGDNNPLHTEQNIVYGMLTASFLSTLAGMYLPGLHSLIQTVRLEFINSMNVSDGAKPITIQGTVTSKEDKFRLLMVKVAVFSTEQGVETKYLFGSMKVKVTK